MSILRLHHISDHTAQLSTSVLINSCVLRIAGGFHSLLITGFSWEDYPILCLSQLKIKWAFVAKNAKAERHSLLHLLSLGLLSTILNWKEKNKRKMELRQNLEKRSSWRHILKKFFLILITELKRPSLRWRPDPHKGPENHTFRVGLVITVKIIPIFK